MVRHELVFDARKLGSEWFDIVARERSQRSYMVGRLSGRLVSKLRKIVVVEIETNVRYQPNLDVALINHCELNARLWGVTTMHVEADERLKFILLAQGYRVIRNAGRNYQYKLEKLIKKE